MLTSNVSNSLLDAISSRILWNTVLVNLDRPEALKDFNIKGFSASSVDEISRLLLLPSLLSSSVCGWNRASTTVSDIRLHLDISKCRKDDRSIRLINNTLVLDSRQQSLRESVLSLSHGCLCVGVAGEGFDEKTQRRQRNECPHVQSRTTQ